MTIPSAHQTGKFAQTAQAFCELIENHPAMSDTTFFSTCTKLLAFLYGDALDLPEVTPCERDVNEQPLTEASQQALDALSARLGSRDMILFDDLRDVYLDLRRGLDFYTSNADCDRREALWMWKFLFYTHWGKHAAHALGILHERISEPMTHA